MGDLDILVPDGYSQICWWNIGSTCTNAPSEVQDTAGIMIVIKRLGGIYTSVVQQYMNLEGTFFMRRAKYVNESSHPTGYSNWTKIV